MTENGRYLEFVESLRLAESPESASASEMRLRPLFGGGRIGSSLVYFNPWDCAAWKTWMDVSFSTRREKSGLFRDMVRALIREYRPIARDRRPRAIYSQRLPGAVMLLRNQKLIVIDRIRGLVFHVLRSEYDSERRLLECEMTASRVLPEQTIPVLHAHLEQSPRFFVQAYLRHELQTWRELLPRLGIILAALFRYYSYFGFRAVDPVDYVDRLAAACRERLKSVSLPEAGEVENQLAKIVEAIRARAAALAPSRIVLTQVHGDFISAHVVMRWDAVESGGFAITDWSESHEYSVFHDLFYFHFQNYESNFVGQVLGFQPEQLTVFFGGGAERLAGEFQERWKQKLTAEYLQLNFLVCFVQELEHRLVRLRGQVVDFWAQQAEKMLVTKS